MLLNTFSLLQKIFVLQSMDFVLNFIGFIVPSLCGGLSGLIIGYLGIKIKDLNKQLQIRVEKLEKILPICSLCKKICNNPEAEKEDRIWIDVTEYLLPQKMSHGYCPDCYKEILENIDDS